jgi:hypothetical protein
MGGNAQSKQIDNPPLCSDVADDMQRNSPDSQADIAHILRESAPRLAALADKWAGLPEPIKLAIEALAGTASRPNTGATS